MQRFKNLNGSGWCINEIARGDDGEYENVEPDNYETINAYQLLTMRPALLRVLFCHMITLWFLIMMNVLKYWMIMIKAFL